MRRKAIFSENDVRYLLEYFLFDFLFGRHFFICSGSRSLTQRVKGGLLLTLCQSEVDDEVEELFDGENVDTLPLEEVVEVGDVLPKEVEGVGMVVLNRLGHVNDVGSAPVKLKIRAF